MYIRVLGPLEVSVGDRPVAVGGTKPRAVLAMLGIEANRTVSADRLIEGLWGERPPASAVKMVQNYVWRLRGALAPDGGAEILTRGRGYELRIDRELVDACRLERLVSEAARAAEAGEPGTAAREALALFHGEPLADVAGEPFAVVEIRRLVELRETAAELAIDADLAAGRHQDLLPEIEALATANPLRERVHAQRMLALYRSGRQAEALEAYRHARHTLVEEIGVEPSPELRRLQDAILRQDPALDVAPVAATLPPELEASTPLIGREPELRALRARWQRGTGGLVTIAGASGMGKTRLAAELAAEVHREGGAVYYATGAPAALAQVQAARRPTLLVLDDADGAGGELRAALTRVAAPVLVLVTAREEAQDALLLGPLDAAGVRAIAGFYAPAGSVAPVDELLLTSGGVPRRVHEAASEWARHEAMRRVDTAAGRAASGRSEARARESELAGSVADLQVTRERAELVAQPPATGPVVCPYKGLASFDAQDAEYFFGREQLVAELVARLVGAPLLAVVGPSGSGKSSVVRAGLLPALAAGVLPGSQGWTQGVLRPGAHPMHEFRRVHRRLARQWHSVLVIDQFEELFTAGADEREQGEFVAALLRAARDESTVVVLALRADFYGRCAAYPELSRLLGANHVLVGPMAREELRRAIERPAGRAGLSVEPELADALLADVEGQPGALPLLSTALLELWRERDGRRLRLAAYARTGGVQGAVARLAEDAFLALDATQRDAARQLLLRLADEDEHGLLVRRRLALEDADASVVAALAAHRLLTIDDGTVEVAHEALLREWPRLRAWLDEDAEARRLHRRLGADARAWAADPREPLYRGPRLAAALEWMDEQPLTAGERAFLDASRRASDRAQRRLRLVLGGVASLLVLSLIATAVALDQRSHARAVATAAAAQGLGSQALADDQIDRALLLARQGMALDDSLQTRGNLLAALLKSPATIGILRGDGSGLTSVALSPDGQTLAFSDEHGALRLVDTATRRPLGGPRIVPGLSRERQEDVLRFSEDGTRLAVGGDRPALLDARTGAVVARLAIAPEQLAFSPRFSPDGLYMLARDASVDLTTLARFDARNGRALAHHVIGRSVSPSLTVAGGRVLSSVEGGPTTIHDAHTLRPVTRVSDGAGHTVLSPDGHTLLLGGRDGSVRLLDLERDEARAAAGRHDGAVVAAAFSADGRVVATAGADNRVMVWDVARATSSEVLAGHTGLVTGLAFSPDGRTLYSSARDGKLFIWDLAGDRRLGRVFATGDPGGEVEPGINGVPLLGFTLRADGRELAVNHSNGTVTLIDTRTLRARATVKLSAAAPAYLPTGTGLVSGGPDRAGALNLLGAPSFSADGRRMAVVSLDGVVALWTVRDGRAVGHPRHYRTAAGSLDASLSPDGHTLALASTDLVEIVDADTLRRRATLPGAQELDFTPDGRYLVHLGVDSVARLYSTTEWRPAGRAFNADTDDVLWQAISPDSRTLALGSTEGTVRLFDVGTQRSLGAPLPAVPNHWAAPQFSPDGAYLYVVTDAGRAFRWDVRPAAWARQACAVAGRSLTRAEWEVALPGRAYAPACR